MSFIELAKNRYSCRSFSGRAVEREKIESVLEAGRIAPTATNSQPVRVRVLETPEAVEKIRGLTRMAYNAPIVLMVSYDRAKSYRASKYGDDHDCGSEDASIVTTHMMLEATDLGLNTLWARGFNAETIEKAFGFSEDEKLVCLLDLGYADPQHGKPSPKHSVRKSLAEFASTL